jgi:hypothetical protein
MTTYSKVRYVGLVSCGNGVGNPVACANTEAGDCGTKYRCAGSGSQTWWGVYPNYSKCTEYGGSCPDQPALPRLSQCGATWLVAACRSTDDLYAGSIRSCGPSNGLERSHPTYHPIGPPHGPALQTCSTDNVYQVCSINVGWTTAIFGSNIGTDITNPYFMGLVYAEN